MLSSAAAMVSPLTLRFESSFLRLKPKILVRQPLKISFPISKSYKTTYFMGSINPRASSQESISSKLRTTAAVIVFSVSMFGKFQTFTARAENKQIQSEEITSQVDKTQENSSLSSLPEFPGLDCEAIEGLAKLMQQKFESGELEESLQISKQLVLAQPENPLWKIAKAKILQQMGKIDKALIVFDEILSENPLQPHALYENAVLMGFNGEGEEAIRRLERALKIAKEENKGSEVIRDVRLIIAQIKFLQKKVEEALRSFDELEKEDPKDCRISFCKGILYYCTDKKEESKKEFDKYLELLPHQIERKEGYMTSSFPTTAPPFD